MEQHRGYHYVGPPEIRDAARTQPSGTPIHSVDDLSACLNFDPTERALDGSLIATFTVGVDQTLRVAPRRSEYVACAAGGPVLAAGEITIDRNYEVVEISNQSIGFCPEPTSWMLVEFVLNCIGIKHPGRFTNTVIFRRCPKCNERNIVKDPWYYCQLCDAKLPDTWNFSPTENAV